MEFKIEPYREFYKLLVEYIPSLGNLNVKPRFIILNIDRIFSEAEKSGFYIKDGKVNIIDEYDFTNEYTDNEVIDIIFKDFDNIGDILVLENSNINSYPFECSFLDFKSKLEKLHMPIFQVGDVVIIWKNKKVITLFHHTGYFAHIFCDSHCS